MTNTTCRTKAAERRHLRWVTLFITAAILLTAALTGLSPAAHASGSGSSKIMTYSDIQQRILWLKDCEYAPFRAGSVWDDAYSAVYTVVYSNGARYLNWELYQSKYCQGFGRLVFDMLFRDLSSTASMITYSGPDKTSDKVTWLKNNLRPGDYLSYGGHVIIVYDVDDTKLSVYDNNHGADPSKYDRKTYFETMGWTEKRFSDHNASTVYDQLEKNPGRTFYIVRTDAEIFDDRNKAA